MNTSLFHGDLVSSNRIIYTPTPFAKTSLLHLQEVGELQAQKPHTSKRTNLLSYLFFIVEAGSGTLHYNGECYTLSKGDCVFLDCKYSYSHCTSEDLWKLKWIHFYGPSMNEIYDKYIQRGGQPTAKDRMYGSLMGAYAIDTLNRGEKNRIVAIKNDVLTDYDITEALDLKNNTLDSFQYKLSLLLSE